MLKYTREYTCVPRQIRYCQSCEWYRTSFLPDSVHVFLLTDENKIRLTIEYPLGTREKKEKIPSGLVNENETPIEAAKRELKEELGLDAKIWEYFLAQESTGALNDTRHYFIAKELIQVTQETDGEVLDTKDYTLNELYEKAMKGQFSSATQAAIARLRHAQVIEN